MTRLESIEDEMNGVVTYELSNGQRLKLNRATVAEHGPAALIRFLGLGHLLPTERAPVMQNGERVGTVAPDFDPLAIKVVIDGHHVGYIPSAKSKTPEVQKAVMALMASGQPYVVEVESYCYRDDNGFNNNHVGKLGAITLNLCEAGQSDIILKDGKQYQRISSLVGVFHPDSIDGLMKWAVNRFKTWVDYEA